MLWPVARAAFNSKNNIKVLVALAETGWSICWLLHEIVIG